MGRTTGYSYINNQISHHKLLKLYIRSFLMALVIRTDGSEEDLDLSDGDRLKKLQTAVGGYIEQLWLGDGKRMIVDEEGILKGKDVNPRATEIVGENAPEYLWKGFMIVGDVVLCDNSELDDEEA
jgi:hypothetical protein